MIDFLLSTGLLSILTLLTNLFGFIRELFFAKAFGATKEADSFIAAFSIVATCFLILSGGALQGAFMPRYQQAIVKSQQGLARQLWRASLAGVVLFSLVLSFLLFFEAERIISIILPGFDVVSASVAANVLKWLSPIIIFYTLGSLFQSVLHAHRKFIQPALVPIGNNIVIILVLIFFVPAFGLVAISYGTVVGGVLWLLLIPFVSTCLPKKEKTCEHSGVKDLFGAILPLVALLLVDQIAGLVQKTLVSDLQEGSIAVLSYAARLEGLPVGIFAGALASVIFPALVEAVARNDKSMLTHRFEFGLSALGFLLMPSTAFLICQSDLIVKILLERGAFDANATLRTARALEFYSVGIFFQGMIVYLSRVYFSLGNTKTPMIIGVFAAAVHILFSWIAVNMIGYMGIAIGTSIYAGLYAVGLMYWLSKYIDNSFLLLLRAVWRSLTISLLIGFLMPWFNFSSSIGGLIQSVFVFGLIYVLFSFIFNEPILRPVKDRCRRAFRAIWFS